MNKRRMIAEAKVAEYTAISRLPENDVHHMPEKGKGFQFGGYAFEKRFPLAVSEKTTKSGISIIAGIDFRMNGTRFELKTNCSTIGNISENGEIRFPMLNADYLVYNPLFDVHMTDNQMIDLSFVIKPVDFLAILESLNLFKDLRPYRNQIQIQVFKTSKKRTAAFLSALQIYGMPARDFFGIENLFNND